MEMHNSFKFGLPDTTTLAAARFLCQNGMCSGARGVRESEQLRRLQ